METWQLNCYWVFQTVKQLVAHCNGRSSGLVQIYPWWSGAVEISRAGNNHQGWYTRPGNEETTRRLLKTLLVDPGTKNVLMFSASYLREIIPFLVLSQGHILSHHLSGSGWEVAVVFCIFFFFLNPVFNYLLPGSVIFLFVPISLSLPDQNRYSVFWACVEEKGRMFSYRIITPICKCPHKTFLVLACWLE